MVRLAAFAAVLLLIFALVLGWRPWHLLSPPPPAVPTRPIAAQEMATIAPEPTLTDSERATVQTWTTRTASMITAARELQTLGQAIRADLAWKGKVRAAAVIITGGKQTIQRTPLPDRFGPLSERAKTATDGCARTVGKLPDVDALGAASVQALNAELDQCVRALELLQVSLSGL
jgi:hypothetical protein